MKFLAVVTLPSIYHLGLTIYWSLNCSGEKEVTTKLGICKLNMDFFSEEEASLGVVPSLSVPITFPGVQ